MSKKVNVLLSAYNGEKYIKAQIDSILNQSYPNVELYVRDDGSKDGTLAIEKGLLHLEAGENVGFVKSFEWLIANGGEADYYAFSDQDDVWFEDKIKMAVEKLEHARENVPVLYFSNYDFYDGDLNFMAHRDGRTPNISFVNSLVDCVSLGFNSVFDERPTVKYRRHNNNVSDGGYSFIKFQIWRFKRFFLNHYFHHIHEQIKEYSELYNGKLTPENQKALALFTRDVFHPLIALRKVFYPKKLRQKVVDEIFVRLVFLIGRL